MNAVIKCFRLPQIEKDLKALNKKFRNANVHLIYAERLLEAGINIPETYPYPGFSEKHKIFKTRVLNTDIGKGKSNGYRLIFEEFYKDNNKQFRLIYMYEKSEDNNESKIKAEILFRLHSPEYLVM
jgi:hypothetical protein